MLTFFKHNIIIHNKNVLPNYDYYLCKDFINKRTQVRELEFNFLNKEPLTTFLKNKKKIRIAEKIAFTFLFLQLLFKYGSFCEKAPKYSIKFLNSKNKPTFIQNLSIRLILNQKKNPDFLFFIQQRFNVFLKQSLLDYIQKKI